MKLALDAHLSVWCLISPHFTDGFHGLYHRQPEGKAVAYNTLPVPCQEFEFMMLSSREEVCLPHWQGPNILEGWRAGGSDCVIGSSGFHQA